MKKPISKKENPGLVKLAKKKPELAEKFGYVQIELLQLMVDL